jgi:TFIIH basal transcription factor complex TTD-A subunit
MNSDPTMKQFLLYLDNIKEIGDKFVLKDLDETHIFIDPAFLDRLKEKFDDLMEKHSFAPDKQQ